MRLTPCTHTHPEGGLVPSNALKTAGLRARPESWSPPNPQPHLCCWLPFILRLEHPAFPLKPPVPPVAPGTPNLALVLFGVPSWEPHFLGDPAQPPQGTEPPFGQLQCILSVAIITPVVGKLTVPLLRATVRSRPAQSPVHGKSWGGTRGLTGPSGRERHLCRKGFPGCVLKWASLCCYLVASFTVVVTDGNYLVLTFHLPREDGRCRRAGWMSASLMSTTRCWYRVLGVHLGESGRNQLPDSRSTSAPLILQPQPPEAALRPAGTLLPRKECPLSGP